MAEIILLFIGLLVGAFVGFLYFQWKQKQDLEGTVSQHPIVIQLKESNERLLLEIKEERTEKEKKLSEVASLQQQLISADEKLRTQLDEMQKLKDEFNKEFQLLANRIFEEKSEKFIQQNKDQLEIVMNPFREKLKEFEQKVDKVYKEENDQRVTLKQEIKQLAELNQKLSTDANNLASALKGDNKAQGNWGELVLEKVLERSGLEEGVNYKKQFAAISDEGARIQPDVVVFLPDHKHIIVDSKVSLIAYNELVAATSDEVKIKFARLHIESVRSHVKTLSEKNYQHAVGMDTPDFVLMFMPMEAAFGAAVQADSELFNFAWDRKIVIVSPSTLLATLRTVESIWKQEKLTRNYLQISEEGGKLYDKLVGFVEDLIAVGKKLDSAKEAYSDAMKKLHEGSGNLVRRAQLLKQLGAKTTKQMNKDLVDRAIDPLIETTTDESGEIL